MNENEALHPSSSLEDLVPDVKVVNGMQPSSDGTIDDGKQSPFDENNACENFQVTDEDLDGIVEIVPTLTLDEPMACHEEHGEQVDVQLIDTDISDASSIEIELTPPSESFESTVPITAVVALASTINGAKSDDVDNEVTGLVKLATTVPSRVIDRKSETIYDDAHDESNATIMPVAKAATVTLTRNDTNGETDNNGRFYALRIGKSTGNCIYLQHSHMADQLEDFPDAQHAVFDDWKDAVAFIQNNPDSDSSISSSTQLEKRKFTSDDAVDSQVRRGPSPSSLGVSDSSISSSTQLEKRKFTITDAIDNQARKDPSLLSLDVSDSSVSSSTLLEKRKFTSDDAADNQARKEAKYEGTIGNEEMKPLQNDPISTPAPSLPEWQSEVYVSVYNTETWDVMYQSLKTFHAEVGNTDVQAGSRLGAWVARQRKEYQTFMAGKESEMTQERVDKLQFVNFFFTSTKKALKFEQRVDEFIKFKEDSENLDPPSNTLLYKWVYSMRRKYRDMKEDKPVSGLDQLKIQRLDEIGFSWTSVKENRKQQLQTEVLYQEAKPKEKKAPVRISKKELRWNELFIQLRTYKEEHGNFIVTRHGSTLGRWVSSQRLAYRKFKNGEIYSPIFNEEKIHKLVEIGFDFECKRGRKSGVEDASVWDEMYEEMQKFKEENGHCIPPTQPSTPLRRWVEKQRSEYKKIRAGEESHLTLMRIQRLNDIDFSFEAKCKPRTWEERYDELVEFKEKFGHCKVPRLYNGLGKWVADQRQKYSKLIQGKKTNMTQEKAQKLTDLGMIWVVFKLPPKEERAERKPWAERFQELLAFQSEHGHTVVPQHFPVLGHWVHTQRVHYKLMKQGRKSLMTPEQAFQLADIGFTFEVMPRKKNTVRQSLGNPYPHLPLIASAGDTPEVTEMVRTFPEHQLINANLDQLKDESAPYHNTDESMIYHNKDDGAPYQHRGDGGPYQTQDDSAQYHNKDDGTAYGIANTFDEYGI